MSLSQDTRHIYYFIYNMESPIETIPKEVLLAWEEMSSKWQEETTWPTLEEASKVYGAAEQDHETASFFLLDLEIQIEDLQSLLKRLKGELPEDQRKIQAEMIRNQIVVKQAEILSCEDMLVLIEQSVQRHREIYHHLLTVHNRKIQKDRFPEKEWPIRQSQCVGCPDELEASEEEESEDEMATDVDE
ncbi:hypothetical protein KR038_001360 [Drosophila bunnanda]|nr:hypothetical protein KR038_001360 [Drosophila bunnanda]